MDLAYVAHSERCALLLDREGICRWVVPKVDPADASVASAKRCIGAQYVATLDRDAPGYMGHEPRVGTNMLFATVTNGRVSLLRFGPLQAFEKLDSAASEAPVTVTQPSEEMLDDSEDVAPVEAERGESDEAPELPLAIEPLPDDIDVEDEKPSELDEADELDALIANGRPMSTDAPHVAVDADVVVDTGSFARASSPDLEAERFMAETERVPLRPSGFMMKQPPGPSGEDTAREPQEQRATAHDDETRRFARASGDAPIMELESTPESPRRGMLPRR